MKGSFLTKQVSDDWVWNVLGASSKLSGFERELWLEREWKLTRLKMSFYAKKGEFPVWTQERKDPMVVVLSTLFKLYAIVGPEDTVVAVLCCDTKEAVDLLERIKRRELTTFCCILFHKINFIV